MENLSENYKSKFHEWPHFLKINLKSKQFRNFLCLGRYKEKKDGLRSPDKSAVFEKKIKIENSQTLSHTTLNILFFQIFKSEFTQFQRAKFS